MLYLVIFNIRDRILRKSSNRCLIFFPSLKFSEYLTFEILKTRIINHYFHFFQLTMVLHNKGRKNKYKTPFVSKDFATLKSSSQDTKGWYKEYKESLSKIMLTYLKTVLRSSRCLVEL